MSFFSDFAFIFHPQPVSLTLSNLLSCLVLSDQFKSKKDWPKVRNTWKRYIKHSKKHFMCKHSSQKDFFFLPCENSVRTPHPHPSSAWRHIFNLSVFYAARSAENIFGFSLNWRTMLSLLDFIYRNLSDEKVFGFHIADAKCEKCPIHSWHDIQPHSVISVICLN